MRIYSIEPIPEEEVLLDGAYECWLTGMVCPKCGLWRSFGFKYPTVDCATLAALHDGIKKHFVTIKGHVRPSGNVSLSKLADPPPMTLEEYESLKASLEPVLGRAVFRLAA